MRRLLTIFAITLLALQFGDAQQDAMFTKYMFNTMNYNPAYTGTRGYLSMGALHRTQWWGIQGAPHSQSLWVHSPIKNDKIGLGLAINNDIIGPTRNTGANLTYSYMIPIAKNGGRLSVGIQGGVTNWRSDWSKLNQEMQGDEVFAENVPSYWLPNVGAGLYYYLQNKYFVGVSVPNIIENDLRKNSDQTTNVTNPDYPDWAKQYRHYYFTAGGAIPLGSDDFIFKPMALVKSVALFSRFKGEDSGQQNVGAPTEVDLDLSVLFYQTLWIGASFRTSVERFAGNTSSFDSADLWVSYLFKNGLRIGAAYDYTLTKLQQPAQGSFEVMLGYDMDFKEKKIVTPRYF